MNSNNKSNALPNYSKKLAVKVISKQLKILIDNLLETVGISNLIKHHHLLPDRVSELNKIIQEQNKNRPGITLNQILSIARGNEGYIGKFSEEQKLAVREFFNIISAIKFSEHDKKNVYFNDVNYLEAYVKISHPKYVKPELPITKNILFEDKSNINSIEELNKKISKSKNVNDILLFREEKFNQQCSRYLKLSEIIKKHQKNPFYNLNKIKESFYQALSDLLQPENIAYLINNEDKLETNSNKIGLTNVFNSFEYLAHYDFNEHFFKQMKELRFEQHQLSYQVQYTQQLLQKMKNNLTNNSLALQFVNSYVPENRSDLLNFFNSLKKSIPASDLKLFEEKWELEYTKIPNEKYAYRFDSILKSIATYPTSLKIQTALFNFLSNDLFKLPSVWDEKIIKSFVYLTPEKLVELQQKLLEQPNTIFKIIHGNELFWRETFKTVPLNMLKNVTDFYSTLKESAVFTKKEEEKAEAEEEQVLDPYNSSNKNFLSTTNLRKLNTQPAKKKANAERKKTDHEFNQMDIQLDKKEKKTEKKPRQEKTSLELPPKKIVEIEMREIKRDEVDKVPNENDQLLDSAELEEKLHHFLFGKSTSNTKDKNLSHETSQKKYGSGGKKEK